VIINASTHNASCTWTHPTIPKEKRKTCKKCGHELWEVADVRSGSKRYACVVCEPGWKFNSL
jgi:predicted RNA-binding Zn-ribbon protein involved in translation (DUF1610 family)